jgi:2-polyprenyl-3-methyl-5-hydroxy-6-metoxy-1,4-benzoquinol methylase
LDIKAVNYCKSKGLNVWQGDFSVNKFEENYFDVIIVNHVIEHLFELDSFLCLCNKYLKVGGKLIVSTPNTNNWQYKLIYKKDWMPLDAPRHLNLFNNENLEIIIKRNNFKITKNISSLRTDAWVSIVSRNLQIKDQFLIGKDKKSVLDLIVGLVQQHISVLIAIFNKKMSSEIILISEKNNL